MLNKQIKKDQEGNGPLSMALQPVIASSFPVP
jgi:hypothetical protein